jgi:hypothetical protein
MLGLPADMGVLRAGEFAGLPWDEASPHAPLADVLRVHDWAYVRKLQVSYAHLRVCWTRSAGSTHRGSHASEFNLNIVAVEQRQGQTVLPLVSPACNQCSRMI